MTESFPRQQARTRNFTLGVPRSFQISPDGNRIVFLRSKGGSDPVTCLWALDLSAGEPGRRAGEPGRRAGEPAGEAMASPERLIADPSVILGGGNDEPAQERARRERSRERAGGVVAFAADAEFTMASFAIAGQVYATGLGPAGPAPALVRTASPAIDPRPDPAGRLIAYVCDGALRIADPKTGADRALIGDADEGPDVSYGLAEFVAAEEMDRHRGYWWAPDGLALLVARVDNAPVRRWHIADLTDPGKAPAEIGYPAAGTPNALVSLLIVRLDGSSLPVRWDRDALPYLTAACWDAAGPLIVVQSRNQRRTQLLGVNPATGQTALVREDTDPHWLDIVPGVPARTTDGQIVWTQDADGARRLLVAAAAELATGAEPVTPADLQVRAVLAVDGQTVLFSASGLADHDEAGPTAISVWSYGPAGLARVSPAGRLTSRGPTSEEPWNPDRAPQEGVHGAVRAGGTTVLTSRTLAAPGTSVAVLRDRARPNASASDADGTGTGTGPDADGTGTGTGGTAVSEVVATISSLAERPLLAKLRVELLRVGPRQVRAAVVLPSWHRPGSAKLPVLMDPYGGPHGQRVLGHADAYLTSQWLADQGFAVVIADGRGTPGRGPAWEREVAGDFAGPVLQDQVDTLTAVAQAHKDLDLDRVAIRGWSFGGYLAALAVLRRPDVFHAAIAGAPVTDWRLYDTHYTERYLGHPDTDGAAYERSSLLADAHKLSRPLMLIHGLADDNVVVAHTLRLSTALLAAGRPHQVLPLSGVTHMAAQERVAENLLLLEVDFLRTALHTRRNREIATEPPPRSTACRPLE